jgi:hypothetical protein
MRRDEWPRVSNLIARGLDRDGRSWFEHVVGEAISFSLSGGADDLKPQLVRTAFEGRVVLATKAFQLMVVTWVLNVRGYVQEEEGKDFADLLWAQVCGSQLDEVVAHVRYYREAKDDEDQRSRFALDVMQHILGGGSPFLLVMSAIMQTTIPELIGHVASIVADGFDDEATFDELQRELRGRRPQ